ncbi:MAG: outer rane autotransporter barrel domain protein, partial [Bradyrhizobium sp.]|nr:outer rane autotransporter barrel domain protein [Bradyrhizobium sp.]
GGTTISAGVVEAAHATAGSIDALGTGAVTIDGGTLRTTVTGSLSNDLNFTAGQTSTLSASAGTTVTLTGGVSADTSSIITFGAAGDTGTVIFDGTALSIDPSARLVVAAGTLRAGPTAFALSQLAGQASTTVNANATLDLADQNVLVRNLTGAGFVTTGSSPATVLGLLPDGGTTQEFSGVISGAGQVQIATIVGPPTATVIFSGNNTYTGGTFVCDCITLQIGNGGTSGSIVGDITNGGTVAFNRSDTYTFDGAIIDDFGGKVRQIGTGTTVLTNDNTYTGGTTVTAGALVIGNGGTTGSIRGNVAISSGATFGVNRSDTYTLANGLNGAGNFAQLGTGTTIFDSAKNYTGTTTISAGTLQIANGGSIDSTAIVDNATLAINRSAGFTLNATVSGTGGFNQIGSGTTTLNAATTYSGATNITAGVLRAGAANVFSSSSAFNVGASGTLNLFTFNQGIGSLAGSGAVTLTTATLTTGSDNTSTTYSGSIAGTGGVTKTGTGNFIYTGTSTYTGATTVDRGTLSINGSIASSSGVTVNSGGVLGGTGTLPGTTINAGGALAPGNSIGTVTVNGNLTFNTGAAYNVEVSPSTSDRTNVTGNATLNGAAVNASFASGTYIAKQYTILNAASISGTFGTLTNTSLPANFLASLSYDTNNAYLDLVLGLPNFGTGLSGNQQNVGNSLINYFNANGGIPAVYGTLTQGGLTQASGEPGASVSTAGFAAMGQFIGAMMDGSGGDGGGAGGLGFADADAYAPNAYASKRKLTPQQSEAYSAVTPRDRMAAPFASRWNVWAAGYGGNSTIAGDASAGTHSTSTRVFGTVVGADYRATPDTRFGFAAGAGSANFAVDSGLGGGRADVFQLGAYARHTIGTAYLAGAVAYGWQDVTTDRTVTISGTDKLRAELKTNALSARLETGWRYAALPVAVTPYAAAQSTTFYLPSYGETATSGSNQFALSYGSKTVTATRGELGFRFDKAMLVRDGVFTLKAKSAWAHDWNTDRSATATFQSLPGATFIVNGAQPSANAALLSLGGEMGWHNGWTLAANFDGEFSRTTQGYAGRGTLKYAW